MDAGRGNSSINDGYRFHGICTALGANELLGGNCYNQPFFGLPIVGDYIVTFLWGGSQSITQQGFCVALLTSIWNCRSFTLGCTSSVRLTTQPA